MREYIMQVEVGNSPITVQELVRCKDCKHYWKNEDDGIAVCLASPKDDAFCSEGEKRCRDTLMQ